jgi:hypothetical protein
LLNLIDNGTATREVSPYGYYQTAGTMCVGVSWHCVTKFAQGGSGAACCRAFFPAAEFSGMLETEAGSCRHRLYPPLMT